MEQMSLNYLLEQKDFIRLISELNKYSFVDIADFLNTLEDGQMLEVFQKIQKDMIADIFPYIQFPKQQYIVENLNEDDIGYIISDLFLDDMVDFLEKLPEPTSKKIIQSLSDIDKDKINSILKYEHDSVGAIMTEEYIALLGSVSVKDAFERIRQTAFDKESIYYIYIINAEEKLEGMITLRKLLMAKDDNVLSDIMQKNPVSVNVDEDKDAAVELIRKYDIISIPVVDKNFKLIGIVTVDDAIDVVEEIHTENIEKTAGLTPSDKPYSQTGVFELSKHRILWLLLLMLTATITGAIVEKNSALISSMAILASFMPLLTDTGGNAGSQSATLIIRALALEDVKIKDCMKVLWKEFRVALICGIALSAVNFARVYLFTSAGLDVAFAVSFSLFLTIIMAKAVGGILPIISKKLNLDPAIMASPLITTIVDTLSLLLYFFVCSRFLV
jgi:magnesium transporter